MLGQTNRQTNIDNIDDNSKQTFFYANQKRPGFLITTSTITTKITISALVCDQGANLMNLS